MGKNERERRGREWGCHFKWEVRIGPQKKVTFKPLSERGKEVSHVKISRQSAWQREQQKPSPEVGCWLALARSLYRWSKYLGVKGHLKR